MGDHPKDGCGAANEPASCAEVIGAQNVGVTGPVTDLRHLSASGA